MKSDLISQLNRPLTIGRTRIDSRLVLAPMTFLGHIAFRELLAGFGGYGLLFGEMCSARRIPQENPACSAYFNWRETERHHLVMQIFGADPAIMAAAARIIEDNGLYGVGPELRLQCGHHLQAAERRGAAENAGPGRPNR
jgi:tRNA-dihydrouridine synthase B